MLLVEEDKRKWLAKLRNPRIETLQRRAVLKAILDKCKKMQYCTHCNSLNGTVSGSVDMELDASFRR